MTIWKQEENKLRAASHDSIRKRCSYKQDTAIISGGRDNVTHSSKRRSKNIIGRAPIVQVCAVSNFYTLAESGQCTPEVPLDKPATSWDQA